jgi:hypothetical protein
VTELVDVNRTAALRAERLQVMAFCSGLSEEAWLSPSAAEGWLVKDVVAHIGSGCHALFTPASLALLRSRNIEQTNDSMVVARREWTPRQVLAEFERWSGRVAALSGIVGQTPLSRVRVRLAELGRFRLGLLLTAAMVFDQHTHLRFDIAPALERSAPPTDPNRMSVVIEWMLAVLSNQLHSANTHWLEGSVTLTLDGPGGGHWTITDDGAIVRASTPAATRATISAVAEQFPEWGTRRCDWRNRNVTVGGDLDYAEQFLDTVNII